ncbi:MAG TPA: YeeE/YedE family protein [Thermodesulfovibrionales bacterium]|jgi:hypothetical protein|nr:YeeE/YedE family protein [Thermodesulfovibrionales bacterium]
MNSAFRDVIFVNDLTLFRSWLLALLVAVIGSNLLEQFGFMGQDGLTRQAFAPLAAIVGGYIFGVGIVMAGGCGSGVLYKQGEGQFAAVIATFGFGVSLIATLHGPLKPLAQIIKQFKVSIGQGEDAITSPALWDLVGGGMTVKWVVIAVVAAIIIPVVLKGKPFGKGPKKGWSWSVGGLLVGVLVVVAWWASYQWGGRARGLSFSGPLAEFLMFVLVGNSGAKNDVVFNLFGVGVASWSALYVIGVPIGAYLSSKGLGEFKWTAPKQVDELIRVFLGGLVMGFGAAIAGG